MPDALRLSGLPVLNRRPDKAQPHPAISLLRLLKIVAKRRKHPLPFRRFSLN
jgi:hypothetical protein